MLALIDGDIVAYRTAAVCEKAAEAIAKWQADQTITRIVEDVNASDWKVYLSGDNNFRYALYPEYKANRRDMVRPKWLEQVREHLVLEWNASVADGYEADDAIGIASQSTELGQSVVCSIDKDLRQLPGEHYHFVNRVWSSVSVYEGWYNFYYQLLVGDATDNIKGCEGIGPVKASKLLGKAQDLDDLYMACSEAFSERYKEAWWKQLFLNAQLLYIWRKENDLWEPPQAPKKVEQEVEVKPSSSGVTTSTSSVPMPMEKGHGIRLDGSDLDTSGLKTAAENIPH